MEVLSLSQKNTTEAAQKAADVLRAGGVILYPTDTLYGLGVDAFSDDAVEKIYGIKGRDGRKPIHAIVSDVEMAERYADIHSVVRPLHQDLPRGKITFIVKKKEGVDSGMCRGIDTFGFRIPDNQFCLEMLRAFGKPITATSANKAGEKPQRSVDVILHQLQIRYSSVLPSFEDRQNTAIDLVIDAGELPESAPSTVIDLTQSRPMILREGAVSASEIWRVLGG